MFNPGPCVYMKKVCVGPRARGSIDINASATDNLVEVSQRLKIPVQELGVVILDRPRHDDLVAEVREAGARVLSITVPSVEPSAQRVIPSRGWDHRCGEKGACRSAARAGLIHENSYFKPKCVSIWVPPPPPRRSCDEIRCGARRRKEMLCGDRRTRRAVHFQDERAGSTASSRNRAEKTGA